MFRISHVVAKTADSGSVLPSGRLLSNSRSVAAVLSFDEA